MNTIQAALAKAAAIGVLTSVAGMAAAAPLSNSQTLAVSATVLGVCKFVAASTPMAFGNLDPSEANDTTLTVDVSYRCTKDTVGTGLSFTGGTARTMSDGGKTLAYTLSIVTNATGTGTGFGASGGALTAQVKGTIAAAALNAAAAGTYSENVTMTIAP